MTISINSETDRDEIRQKIGATVDREELRTGRARRRRLEQASQRRTRTWDLSLDIDPNHPTAHVDMEKGSPEVVVTGRELDQPLTDFDGQKWDYVAQRALAWHEAGHVLFTDHDDFMDRLNILSPGEKGTAKQIWNALEDGAIEKGLGGEWSNAYDVLRVLRANLFAQTDAGIQDVERGGRVFPLAHATQAVLLEEWMAEVYDLDGGTREMLTDRDEEEMHFANDEDWEIFVGDILPLVDDVVPDVLSEPNAVDRNRRIFEFIEEVMEHISDGKADGKSQMNRDEGQSEEGMPDDATEGHSGEAQEDIGDLDDVDPEDIEGVTTGDDDGSESGIEPGDVELPDDIEEDISQQQIEESGAGDEMVDEVEEITKILDSGPDTLVSDEILLPDEQWDANDRLFEEAKNKSRPLAQLLRNRLQQERHSEVKRHQRRGRFTGRGGAARRAQRGDKEVKERIKEPEEKEYDFAFVVDRSGSMSGTMRQAEQSMIMLALALEEVGVETMVIEMFRNEARLAKPFGVSVEKRKSELTHGEVSGSTPLSPSVELARERLNRMGDNTGMVVVTDGEPDDEATFEETIRKCSMPVLGVSLTGRDDPAGMGDYERAVAADPREDLQEVLSQLIQEVMFS